jgi:hypothetical protein
MIIEFNNITHAYIYDTYSDLKLEIETKNELNFCVNDRIVVESSVCHVNQIMHRRNLKQKRKYYFDMYTYIKI